MLQRTPLCEWHVANGARMVDFAGWDMPIQYTTIVEEHQSVRHGAGLFDISHMGRLAFTGPNALALVQKLYTNNAATMKEGQVRYGLVCNDQGGIRDDVLVYRWSDGYGMVVNASNRPKILDWIATHKPADGVRLEDQTLETCMIAVQGPKALEFSRGLTPANLDSLAYYFACQTTFEGQKCIISRTGYTGEDGLEFSVPAHLGPLLWAYLLGKGAKACGLGARDTLRLEAGMPLYGHELSEETDPFQAGLAWAVKMDKGDFIGRAALEKRRGDASRRVRVGLELEGKRIAREGAAVLHDGREIGTVTSGTLGPTLGKVVAMAYVEPAHAAVGTACSVDVRGKPAAARVVSLPFYRRPRT